MSQNDQILKWLQAGNTLTPMQALRRFQCLRLSGRVLDLRKSGHDIKTEMVSVGDGKRVARYRMAS